MPWTLRFSGLDDRINGRAFLDRFRSDEAVRGVTASILADNTMEVQVDFHEGFDAPTNLLLRRDASPYLVLEEIPIDIEPIPRHRGMEEGFRLNYGFPPRLDDETRQRIIGNFLNSVSGREHLAQAMVAPLRQRLDYQATARRTFLVEEMPEGAIPVYDRDPNVVDHLQTAQEFYTPGHDTDYLALPGHLPLHATLHYKEPGELPPWIAVGCWVRERPDGRVGMVVNHYRTEDRQRRAHLHIILGIWRTTESVDLCAHNLVLGWEPCQQPPEPLSIWARILGDDFLDD